MINIRNGYLLNVRFHRYTNNNLFLYYNHESQMSNYAKCTAYKRVFFKKREFLVSFIDQSHNSTHWQRDPFLKRPNKYYYTIDYFYTWPKRRGVERLGDSPSKKNGGGSPEPPPIPAPLNTSNEFWCSAQKTTWKENNESHNNTLFIKVTGI